MLPRQPPVRVRGDLPLSPAGGPRAPLNPAGILRAVIFYLFTVFVVFYLFPLGPYLLYPLLIAVAFGFVALAGAWPRFGSPLPGLTAGALAISATFGLILASGGVAVAGVTADALAVLLGGIVLQAFVASGEEAAFRGYLLEDLRRQIGPAAAVIITALGFAALHLRSMFSLGISPASGLIALATITAAGVLLGVICLRWGLLSAIGFHFAWNLLQYHVFGLGMPGEFQALLRLSGAGNPLLTGGEFGPEASLPGLLIMLITLGAVLYLYRRKITQGRLAKV